MVWKDPIYVFLYGFIDKLDSAMDLNSLEPRVVREAWAGALPLDSLIGGLLGEVLRVRPVIFLSGDGLFLGWLWVLFSPLRTLHRFPTGADSNGSALGYP